MKVLLPVFLFLSAYCMAQATYKTIGVIERYDSVINQILSPDAKAEIIAEGFKWSEGPLWVEKQRALQATSTVALSADEKTLYITNNMQVLRLQMRK